MRGGNPKAPPWRCTPRQNSSTATHPDKRQRKTHATSDGGVSATTFAAAKLLTRDEAQRIAVIFAQLPELLGEPEEQRTFQFRLPLIRESLCVGL